MEIKQRVSNIQGKRNQQLFKKEIIKNKKKIMLYQLKIMMTWLKLKKKQMHQNLKLEEWRNN